jgi:hypothetical protein
MKGLTGLSAKKADLTVFNAQRRMETSRILRVEQSNKREE